MKEFIINNYLEDIRKKIPAYDLMLEIIFNSILKIETNISQIKNILSIGGQSFEVKNLSSSDLIDTFVIVFFLRVTKIKSCAKTPKKETIF